MDERRVEEREEMGEEKKRDTPHLNASHSSFTRLQHNAVSRQDSYSPMGKTVHLSSPSLRVFRE